MKSPQNEGLDTSVDAFAEKASTQGLIDIGARIKAARLALKLTQDELAKLAGARSKSGLQDNEAGKNMPGGQMIRALVQAGVNSNWLLTGDGEMLLQAPEKKPAANYSTDPLVTVLTAEESRVGGYVALPLFNGVRAAAGHGAMNGTEINKADDALMFQESWIRHELGTAPQNLFLIRVTGDSMEPTLRAGEVILVDRSASRPNREGIYFMRMDDMLLVKRLQALPGGRVRVTSDNPAFEAYVVDHTDLAKDFEIYGRVVWSGRRL